LWPSLYRAAVSAFLAALSAFMGVGKLAGNASIGADVPRFHGPASPQGVGQSAMIPRATGRRARAHDPRASASWPGNASIGADAPRFHGPQAPGRRPVGHDPQGNGPPGKSA